MFCIRKTIVPGVIYVIAAIWIPPRSATIAFVVCSVLGCADKKEYNKYMEVFISRLPLAMQTTKVIDEKLEYIKKQAVIILAAGGYYDERN